MRMDEPAFFHIHDHSATRITDEHSTHTPICFAMPRLLSFLLFAVLIAPAAAQTADLYAIQKDVAFLSSDLLMGRETGTEGEALAARYIAERFEGLRLTPGADGDWFQSFGFTFSTTPHAEPGEGEARTGRNIVGLIDNGASETVVIGAHYDHLGHGTFGSRQPDDHAIHNGADDNASGVAALFAIAERLQMDDAPKNRNYLFLAFSGEELGLYGSKYWVDAPTLDIANVAYMINLDMVGRLNEAGELAVNGSGTSPVWNDVIAAAAEPVDLDAKLHESGLGPSDHASFYLADIPVLHLFTGQHEDYHKASDDSDLVNYDGLDRVARFATGIIAGLDGQAVPFTKTRDESQGRMSFNVTLGVMPDYVYDGEGMRIDAFLDDRPGKVAGMQKDDVLISLGGSIIAGMQDYMRMLSELEPGQTVPATVLRDGQRVELSVTF